MPTSSETFNIDFRLQTTYPATRGRGTWTTTNTTTATTTWSDDAFARWVKSIMKEHEQQQEKRNLEDWEKVMNSGST